MGDEYAQLRTTEDAPRAPRWSPWDVVRETAGSLKEIVAAEEAEDISKNDFTDFIPLFRFQHQKLYGTVALVVFRTLVVALLVMNAVTWVVVYIPKEPWFFGKDFANVDDAMADHAQIFMLTGMVLLVNVWHRKLYKRVETLAPYTTSKADSCRRLRLPCRPRGQVSRSRLPSSASAVLSPASAQLADDGGKLIDVFISHYESDDNSAERIATALQQHSVLGDKPKVKRSHVGLSFERAQSTMVQSRLIVPVISRQAIEGMTTADKDYNATLLEWDYALDLDREGVVDDILPARVPSEDNQSFDRWLRTLPRDDGGFLTILPASLPLTDNGELTLTGSRSSDSSMVSHHALKFRGQVLCNPSYRGRFDFSCAFCCGGGVAGGVRCGRGRLPAARSGKLCRRLL